MCLSNLILTGCAVPFLHNGIMSADENDATNFEYGDGKVGITTRNDIGFLTWLTNESDTQDKIPTNTLISIKIFLKYC